MAHPDHYRILEVSPTATQAEIKQAYRRLAKLFHPDSNRQTSDHDQIARVNAAYEILGDPQNRRSYDQQRLQRSQVAADVWDVHQTVTTRQQRTAAAQAHYRRQQHWGQQADEHLELWLHQVYSPVTRLIQQILKPLQAQINELAADPFDDELMADFQDYLEDCHDRLSQAEHLFRSVPNPPAIASVAAHLYYCLDQIGDGIQQLEFFTTNYDDYYLHTGQELFRIANGLRREAQAAIREMA